ncbi:MAG: DUF362 domain-containing protein [Candidatus Nanoarchaeia archaeon]|jgi:hypothetical protein
MGLVFVQGVNNNMTSSQLTHFIRKVFLKSTNNLSWLKKGDKVMLKPALNSPDPYPATTHPLSVKVVFDLLKARRADVFIADQSGVEHVVNNEQGIVRGSSLECFKKSGMWFKGANFIPIESTDWEKDYFNFKAPSWNFHITKLIKQADHIINLPRLSTHSQAGVTLGLKSIVGLLREDSRLDFHNNGPFNFGIKGYTKETGLAVPDDKSGLFFEKMTEIMLAVKDKLRVTLFTATKANVSFGPDKSLLGLFKSGVAKPRTGLVFASNDLLSAEVFALSFLKSLYSCSSFTNKFWEKFLLFCNGSAKELSKECVWTNPFIKHALKIGLGKKELKVEYNNVPEELKNELNNISACD